MPGPSGTQSERRAPPVKRYRRQELDEDASKSLFSIEDGDSYEEYVPIKKRNRDAYHALAASAPAEVAADKKLAAAITAANPELTAEQISSRAKESLLIANARARLEQPEATEADKALEEEQDMMRLITQKQALKSGKELAQDIKYTRSMFTGWKPPLKARLTREEGEALAPDGGTTAACRSSVS